MITQCPFCSLPGSIVREFQRREEEILQLWRCASCRCEFLHPQPSDRWLAHEYSGYFAMRQGQIAAPKARLCQLILSKLGALRDDAHILDIGGGEGFFVDQVLQSTKNVRITLVEPQAEQRMMSLDRVTVYRKFVEDWLHTTPPEQYDIIVAMDLVEHLRRPLEVMADVITTRLRPGGSIIITTPDAASHYRRFLGRFWPHYKVEHLTYPSEGALLRLAEVARLDVRECRSFGKPLPIGYMIAVLRNFGPASVRSLGRVVDVIVPNCIRRYHVCIPSGELLFHATKKGEC